VIPDPILVPVAVLAGCAAAIGFLVGRPRERPHTAGDPAYCDVCRALIVADDNAAELFAVDAATRRRLARYVAGRTPGRSA
jgi:hypothetical protein